MATPVGMDDTCPNPALHQPDAYVLTSSLIDAVIGAICPTPTTPSRKRLLEPTTKTAASIPHNTYALRAVASRV